VTILLWLSQNAGWLLGAWALGLVLMGVWGYFYRRRWPADDEHRGGVW
jgi:hypothetical protein